MDSQNRPRSPSPTLRQCTAQLSLAGVPLGGPATARTPRRGRSTTPPPSLPNGWAATPDARGNGHAARPQSTPPRHAPSHRRPAVLPRFVLQRELLQYISPDQLRVLLSAGFVPEGTRVEGVGVADAEWQGAAADARPSGPGPDQPLLSPLVRNVPASGKGEAAAANGADSAAAHGGR